MWSLSQRKSKSKFSLCRHLYIFIFCPVRSKAEAWDEYHSIECKLLPITWFWAFNFCKQTKSTFKISVSKFFLIRELLIGEIWSGNYFLVSMKTKLQICLLRLQYLWKFILYNLLELLLTIINFRSEMK